MSFKINDRVVYVDDRGEQVGSVGIVTHRMSWIDKLIVRWEDTGESVTYDCKSNRLCDEDTHTKERAIQDRIAPSTEKIS